MRSSLAWADRAGDDEPAALPQSDAGGPHASLRRAAAARPRRHRQERAKTPEGAAPAEESVVGIALWASVSAAVDAKISEQIKANAFPVRLAPEDWTSGDTVWLLDLIAVDRQQATSVLANFRQIAGERPVKIAPLAARLIDPEVAERLRGAEAEKSAAPRPDIPEPQGRA